MTTAGSRSWVWGYGVVALVTLLFQWWVRLAQCEGAANCAVSFAKAVVWSAIWPASWIVYLAGFIPR